MGLDGKEGQISSANYSHSLQLWSSQGATHSTYNVHKGFGCFISVFVLGTWYRFSKVLWGTVFLILASFSGRESCVRTWYK